MEDSEEDYSHSEEETSLQFENISEEDESDSDSEEEYEEDQCIDEDDDLPTDVLTDYNIPTISNDCVLKTKEIDTIESCHHKELKNLLLLNRSKNFMLMQLFKRVKDLLINCRSDIESLTKIMKYNDAEEKYCLLSPYLAAPYFKTKKHMMSGFPNKDTVTRRKNGELSIYQTLMSPKWSKMECDNLISIVKLTYNHNTQKDLLKQISTSKFQLNKASNESSKLALESQINMTKEKLQLAEKDTNNVPPQGSDDFIDWDYISQEYFDGRHSGNECRAFWHVYLHPSIVKSNWTAEENDKIKKLVEEHKTQDWDKIALLLGTNRSGFSVCLHYLSNLCEVSKNVRFTKEEDDLILQWVEKMRVGAYIPWGSFEHVLPNRSRNQIVHRYKHFLSKNTKDVKPFSDAEDILLLVLVERFGRNYSHFAHYFKNRTHMQVKSRYDSKFKVPNTKKQFTVEEDQTIMQFVAHQKYNKFGNLASLMNRKRGQVRQRYLTLTSFLEKNPNLPLSKAPRRVQAIDNRKLDFLKYFAEQYRNAVEVPTIEEIEEKLGVKTSCSGNKVIKITDNSNIDALLTNFFSNAYKKEKKNKAISPRKIHEAADNIYNILNKWNVHLNIPKQLCMDNFLDVIDLEILELLKNKYNDSEIPDLTTTPIENLIPPNINSLVGLRGLMFKNQLYKKKKKRPHIGIMEDLPLIRNPNDYQLASELIDMFDGMNSEHRTQIENGRFLFISRFISLYMWPAILSMESPCAKLLDAELGIKKTSETNKPKENQKNYKKKGKKNNNASRSGENDEPVKKKRKLNPCKEKVEANPTEAPSTSCRRSARLRDIATKPVNNDNHSISSDDDKSEEANKPPKPKSNNMNKSNITKTNNGENSNVVKPKKIVKLVKISQIENKSTKEHIEDNMQTAMEVPSSLRKVDKSEIENMLKNKKPVKMFLIRKIKLKDGSIKTIAKPLEDNKLPIPKKIEISTQNSSTDNPIRKQRNGDSILDVISLSDSVKRESVRTLQEKKVIETAHVLGINKLKSNLKNNLKQYSRIRNTPSTQNYSLNTNKAILNEDLCKLNTFLENCGTDDAEIFPGKETEHDVKLLDDLIRSETDV